MAERSVTVRLNQQQLELIENTVKRGVAADREALLRRALHEYWKAHFASAPKKRKKG